MMIKTMEDYSLNMERNREVIKALKKRITELEDLAQMIIDGESADPSLIPIMYHTWLNKAKALKE